MMQDSKTIAKAFYLSLPVMSGYLVLSFAFGMLMQKNGFGPLWSFAMSTFIFAGSMQYVAIGLLTGAASLITMAVTTFMVNARHLFYGVSVLDLYRGAGAKKPYMIFALTDETYSIVCSEEVRNHPDRHRLIFFLSLFNQSYWVLGSVLGALIGPALPFNTAGIEFSMTALFTASCTEMWRIKENRIPILAGLALTALSRLIFGQGSFLIPAVILITFSLTIGRKFLDHGKEADADA